jgi:hypothetical protein
VDKPNPYDPTNIVLAGLVALTMLLVVVACVFE